MQTVLISDKGGRGETEGHKEAMPSRVTTTLYHLVAALQEVAGADDAQVVATLVHLLRAGRLTWGGPARGPLGLSRHAAMGTRQRVSPQTATERC